MLIYDYSLEHVLDSFCFQSVVPHMESVREYGSDYRCVQPLKYFQLKSPYFCELAILSFQFSNFNSLRPKCKKVYDDISMFSSKNGEQKNSLFMFGLT